MFSYRRNHFGEPKDAQRHHDCIADHEHGRKPPRRLMFQNERPFGWRVIILGPRGLWCMQRRPDITEKHNGEIRTP